MARASPHGDGVVMDNIADGAHQLQRAAGWLQERASEPGAVTALPAALAHADPTGDAAPAWSRGRAPMQSRADGAAAAR